jgi:hypothetical protein
MRYFPTEMASLKASPSKVDEGMRWRVSEKTKNSREPPPKEKKMMCLPTNFKYTYRYSSRYLQQKYNLQVIPDLLLETA